MSERNNAQIGSTYTHKKEGYSVKVEDVRNYRRGYRPGIHTYVWFRRTVPVGRKLVTPMRYKQQHYFLGEFILSV